MTKNMISCNDNHTVNDLIMPDEYQRGYNKAMNEVNGQLAATQAMLFQMTRINQQNQALHRQHLDDLEKISVGLHFISTTRASKKAFEHKDTVQPCEKPKEKKALMPRVSNSHFIMKPLVNRPNPIGHNFKTRKAQSRPTTRFQSNFSNINTKGQNRTNSCPGHNKGKCTQCEKPHHPGKQCNGNDIVCYFCHEEGHKLKVCPKKASACNTPCIANTYGIPTTVEINFPVHASTLVDGIDDPMLGKYPYYSMILNLYATSNNLPTY